MPNDVKEINTQQVEQQTWVFTPKSGKCYKYCNPEMAHLLTINSRYLRK